MGSSESVCKAAQLFDQFRWLVYDEVVAEEGEAFLLGLGEPVQFPGGPGRAPVGQLAWINDPLMGFGRYAPPEPRDRDTLLTNASIYWFTETAGSSARWYFEDAKSGAGDPDAMNPTPTGVAVLPYNFQSVRAIAERSNNIVHWSTLERGGHFAALDAPDFLVGDLRTYFRRFH